jgi:zinc/manganese transport system ATP-binding protein
VLSSILKNAVAQLNENLSPQNRMTMLEQNELEGASHLGGRRPQRQAPSARPWHKGVGVELDHISAFYADRLAFAGLSGSFAVGSLTAVVGPNGAGKSSLLKAIAGTLPLQFGAIVCGSRHHHDLAYLPQQAELARTFPIEVGELIALGAWRSFGSYRRPPDEVFERVAQAAAATGLENVLKRPVEELSVGELQRALFARLLLQDAAVILLDEPFAAVDERTTEDLMGLVRRWHKEGRTVIAVLHDLERVREDFPTTLLLARTCIAWGETASVLTADNLTRARKALQERGNEGLG